MTLASCGFSLALSGMMIPPELLFLFLDVLHEHAITDGFDFTLAISGRKGYFFLSSTISTSASTTSALVLLRRATGRRALARGAAPAPRPAAWAAWACWP
jgi:hypothetical protein